MLKARQTYEIMDAEMVGLKETQLVLGKHSGRHAFSQKLKELGYDLDKDALNKAFERFKLLADKKKEISDKDLTSIVADEAHHIREIFSLDYVQVTAGNTTRPAACVQLRYDDEVLEKTATGAGPVDAIFQTIDKIIGEPIDLVDFAVHAVTGGTDALGEVTVRIKGGDRIFTGRGADMDVLVVSSNAYLQAINKMLAERDQYRIKATV